MASGEKVAQPLVDWNDCVGTCILLINIAIKYINKGAGWVGGGYATDLLADLQARMLHTDNAGTPQTLHESSDATQRCELLLWRWRAVIQKPTGPSRINTEYRFFFFFFLHLRGENKLFDFCLLLTDMHLCVLPNLQKMCPG